MLSASSLRSKLQTLNMELGRLGAGGGGRGGSGGGGGVGGVFSSSLSSSGDNSKSFISPYDCDKARVLQEARAFSESPLDVRKCCHIITKILYLLWSGEAPLTTAETSTLFFGVTRLFQSSDDHLRRMIYMLLKELPVASAEAFIVTSSLTKDLTSGSGKHRANAVRVLSRIVDPAMAGQIERYLKTAVVDKNTFVASSALVCGINLFPAAPEVIRRWGNEIQGCIQHHSSAAAAANAAATASPPSRGGRSGGAAGFLRKAADLSGAAAAAAAGGIGGGGGAGGVIAAPMVQLHALVLLHRIKANDPLALQKSLCELVNSFAKSPVAECFLLRYIKSLFQQELEGEAAAAASSALAGGAAAGGRTAAAGGGAGFLDSQAQQQQRILLEYMETCMRHRHEMVMFEAARSLCELAAEAQQLHIDAAATTTAAAAAAAAAAGGGLGGGSLGAALRSLDLSGAITVLQILLSSPKPVIRFAAVREAHRLAQRGLASAVSRCNGEIEALLNDPNRSTATLAFTTLLKTGQEGSVERLLKQISSFSSDVSDAFRLDIVRAVLQLCLQYPNKHKTLMAFLGSTLREEGSLELKTCAVDALIQIVRLLPQAQELGLLQLCEFIEDCEYPTLCTSILAFLGDQAPTAAAPSKFIRFIYNRLILENALVRAAGVDALAKIASRCPTLLPDVLVLLEACLKDNDDEVRDRANLYYTALQQELRRRQAPSLPSGSSSTAAAATPGAAAAAAASLGSRGGAEKAKGKQRQQRRHDRHDAAAAAANHVGVGEAMTTEELGTWREADGAGEAAAAAGYYEAKVECLTADEQLLQQSPTASTCDEGVDDVVPSIDELLNPDPPVALEPLCAALQQLAAQPQLRESPDAAAAGWAAGGGGTSPASAAGQQQQQPGSDGAAAADEAAAAAAAVAETLIRNTLASLPSEQQWREQREREAAAMINLQAAACGMGAGGGGAAGGLAGMHAAGVGEQHRGGIKGGTAADLAAAGGGAAGAAAAAGGGVGGGAASRSSSGPPSAAQQQQQRLQHRRAEFLRVLGDRIDEETLGPLLHSSGGTMLTEKEAEYAVEVAKHFFPKHVVLEFYLRNTVEGQTLENVYVKVTPPGGGAAAAAGGGGAAGGWTVVTESAAAALPYNASRPCYVLLERPAAGAADLAVFPAVASYVVKEAGDDIGYEDEYPVEHVVLSVADYMAPKLLRQGEFQVLWHALEAKGGGPNPQEAVGKFSLNFRSLDAAVVGLIETLNMAACEKSDVVDPHKASHTLLLSGTFLGTTAVISKAMLFMSPEHGCLLKLVVRSENGDAARALLQAFE